MRTLTLILWLAANAGALELHVAPNGHDGAAGTADAPLATLAGAQAAYRAHRDTAQEPVTVLLHAGRYELAAPLTLTPEDSRVTWQAAGDGPVLISGGTRLGGWRTEGPLWVLDLPDVAAGKWTFNQLFVDGRRATRARLPKAGFFHMAAYDARNPKSVFYYAGDDLRPWPDLSGATLVVYHSWETSLLPIAALDPAKHEVRPAGEPAWPYGTWGPNQRYCVENLASALTAPGEWQLDHRSGRLRYWPLPGQTPETTEVVAPRLMDLVRFRGAPALGLPCSDIVLRGLTLQHADWELEPKGHSDPQAVCTLGAALTAEGADACKMEDCRLSHLGRYGVWLRRGCHGWKITRCEFGDVGAGAVRIGETQRAGAPAALCDGHSVDNCWIHDYGQVYAGAVALFIAHSGGNRLTHNDIADGPYTGISVGWDWGRAPTDAHENLIAYNHIHHIVNGVMSDAGGIYLLGELDGTQVLDNWIHDIVSFTQPRYAWGLYLDAETHHVTAEDNVIERCMDGLMLHNGAYGNVLRGNRFSAAADWLIWRAPPSIPEPNTFENNVCEVTQGDLFYPDDPAETRSVWNHNVYADAHQPLLFMDDTFAEWQAGGPDHDSRLVNAAPAAEPPEAGLYGDAAWVAQPRGVPHQPVVLPPTTASSAGPHLVDEDFEDTAVGQPPKGANVLLGTIAGGRIEVTDALAASGKHCLAVIDAPGLEHVWDPHFFYEPHLRSGTARLRFALRYAAGALPYIEWRSGGYPYRVGPSLKIEAGGKLTANGRELRSVPADTWLRFEVVCALGKAGDGHYAMTLRVGDEAPQEYRDLACDAAFSKLNWLGFVSLADVHTEFWLDDIKLDLVAR
jgi:hypothetical protein